MPEERFIRHEDGTVVVENPGTLWHLLQLKYALRIEVRTGMRTSSGSPLKVLQQRYGIKARTKVKALTELEELIKETVAKNRIL